MKSSRIISYAQGWGFAAWLCWWMEPNKKSSRERQIWYWSLYFLQGWLFYSNLVIDSLRTSAPAGWIQSTAAAGAELSTEPLIVPFQSLFIMQFANSSPQDVAKVINLNFCQWSFKRKFSVGSDKKLGRSDKLRRARSGDLRGGLKRQHARAVTFIRVWSGA